MSIPVPPGSSALPPLPPAATPPPSRKPWRWLVHLLVLAAYPVVIGLLGAGRAATSAPALTHSSKGLVMVFAIQFGLFAVVFGFAWLASRASWDDLLGRWRGGVWIVPLSLGYSVLLRLALGFIGMLLVTFLMIARLVKPEEVQNLVLANRPDVSALVDVSALRQNPLYFWLTVTLISFVLAGFREELWRSGMLAGLRALWPRTFGSTPGQILAAALAAVVFGLGHLAQGPIAACAAGLLGLGLGLIMVVHRSIWPAVIAHGTFDATTFALLPWVLEKLPALR